MPHPTDFVRSLPGDPAALSVNASRWRRWHIDLHLLLLLIVLSIYGLLVLYSASGKDLDRVTRQFVYLCIAFSALFVVAQLRVKTMLTLAPIGYLTGLGMLVLVLLVGDGAKGAQR